MFWTASEMHFDRAHVSIATRLETIRIAEELRKTAFQGLEHRAKVFTDAVFNGMKSTTDSEIHGFIIPVVRFF